MSEVSFLEGSRGGLHPEFREAQQLQWVRFPLGEQVINFIVALVVTGPDASTTHTLSPAMVLVAPRGVLLPVASV